MYVPTLKYKTVGRFLHTLSLFYVESLFLKTKCSVAGLCNGTVTVFAPRHTVFRIVILSEL